MYLGITTYNKSLSIITAKLKLLETICHIFVGHTSGRVQHGQPAWLESVLLGLIYGRILCHTTALESLPIIIITDVNCLALKAVTDNVPRRQLRLLEFCQGCFNFCGYCPSHLLSRLSCSHHLSHNFITGLLRWQMRIHRTIWTEIGRSTTFGTTSRTPGFTQLEVRVLRTRPKNALTSLWINAHGPTTTVAFLTTPRAGHLVMLDLIID